MNHARLSLPFLAALSACHTWEGGSASGRSISGPVVEAVEAALIGAGPAAAAPAEPEVLAVDPVVVELVRSAFHAYSERRRVILENIANLHTPAYKKRIVLTRTKTVRGAGNVPVPIPVQLDATPVFTTGALAATERALDLAIDGDGFLAVTLTDGSTGYTRAGGLHVNARGKFVTAGGNVLLPEITIPKDTLGISIQPNGLVCGRTAGAPDTVTCFGQITLHRFVNPDGLLPIDATTWRRTESSGPPCTGQPGLIGLGLLKQGFIEQSNVSLEIELLNLQHLERQHKVLAKVLAQFGMIAP